MHELVQDYYGRTLQSSADLRTSACCDASAPPPALRPVLGRIHPEVLARYYGCGLVSPPLLEGCRVLDLGCGSGRDVYALAQLVGEHGEVVGVDMTAEQLAVARRHEDYHREAFGFARSNVRFLEGYIERLGELGLEDASFDVIVSNCVINLCPDKAAVLREVFRLLRNEPIQQTLDFLKPGIHAAKQAGLPFLVNAGIQNTLRTAPERFMAYNNGIVVVAGKDVQIPVGTVVTDLKGRRIYPALIDIESDYGMPEIRRTQGGGRGTPPQIESNKKGAYGWNQAINAEADAVNCL